MNILFYLKPKNEVAFLYDDYTVRQAIEKIEHYKYTAIPVISRDGKYIGTMTEGDLLWFIKKTGTTDLYLLEEIPMSQVKRRWHNDPVNVNSKMEDLIQAALNQNFVPVIDDNDIFIGIVTRRDIILHYVKENNQ